MLFVLAFLGEGGEGEGEKKDGNQQLRNLGKSRVKCVFERLRQRYRAEEDGLIYCVCVCVILENIFREIKK